MKLFKLIFLLFALPIWVNAQVCSVTDNTFVGTVPSLPYNSTGSWGGDYYTMAVTLGNTYNFTTCTSSAFDTELSLTDDANPTVVLATDNNSCGTSSDITWTATLTGTIRVILDNAATCAFTPISQNLDITLVSTGPTITTWNGSVWDNGTPTASVDAIIDGAYNVATYGNIIAKDLTINASGSITMASGTIEVAGDLAMNGATPLTQTGGAVIINGAVAQTISGAIQRFRNLTINNSSGGVSMSSFFPPEVSGVLYLQQGVLSIGVSSSITLKSTSSTETGMIRVGSGTVSGTVTAERFMDGSTQSGYRYISSPIASTDLSAVTDDITFAGVGSTFSPGTSTSYTWNTTSPYPNAFFYDEALIGSGTIGSGSLAGKPADNAQYGWETPTTATDAFAAGKGLAVRIDANATLDFSGTPNSGDIPVSLTHGGQTNSGWHLLGNPYPSPLDWNAVFDDGHSAVVEPTAYVFDANGSYTGDYTTWNASSDVGTGSEKIALGQAFFVRSTSTGGTLTMKNSHRLTSNAGVSFYRTKAPEKEGLLRLNVADEAGKRNEMVIYFIEGAQKGFDSYDARAFFELSSNAPTIYSYEPNEDNRFLLDCRTPVGAETQSFQLHIQAVKAGNYTLSAKEISYFPVGTEILLEDKEANMMIDLQQVKDYSFQLDANQLSENRFLVHLKQSGVTSIEDDLADKGVSIWGNDGNVYLQFASPDLANAKVAFYSITGQQLANSQPSQLNASTLVFSTAIQGIFIVKVETEKGASTKKLWLD